MEEMRYDREEDILNLQLKKGGYWKSVELPNGVVIDISRDGSVLPIEIAQASKVFSGDMRTVITAAKPMPA